jgi:hypothetical protein
MDQEDTMLAIKIAMQKKKPEVEDCCSLASDDTSMPGEKSSVGNVMFGGTLSQLKHAIVVHDIAYGMATKCYCHVAEHKFYPCCDEHARIVAGK